MAELFQRAGSPYFYAWLRDPRAPDGLVKRSTKRSVKGEARRVAEGLQLEIDRQLEAAAAGPDLWWSDAAALFLRLAPLRDSTRAGHKSQIEVIKASCLGDFHLAGLQQADIKAFVLARRQQLVQHKGTKPRMDGPLISDATIRRNLSLISRVYEWHIDHETPGIPEVNPFSIFNRKPLKESPEIDRQLRPAQFQQLIESCSNPEHRRMFIVLAGSGLRSSELLRLTWDECNLESRTIEFGNLVADRSKNSRSRRVPILDGVFEALTAQFTAHKTSSRPNPQGLVFPSRSAPYGQRYNLGPLRKAMKRVPSLKGSTIHGFRHTFASWLLDGGADPLAIRDALGHRTLSTTTRYARRVSDKVAEQLRGINFPLPAQSTAQKHRFENDEKGRTRKKLGKSTS
jgi:integrase